MRAVEAQALGVPRPHTCSPPLAFRPQMHCAPGLALRSVTLLLLLLLLLLPLAAPRGDCRGA